MQIDLEDPRLSTDEFRDLMKIARRLEAMTRTAVNADPPRGFNCPVNKWGHRHDGMAALA